MNLFLFAATILQIITTTKGQAPSQCTVDCAEATCPSNMTDISCFCDHANQTGIISCLQTKCSQAEVQAAQVLQIVICGSKVSGTATGSSSGSATSAHSSSTGVVPGTTSSVASSGSDSRKDMISVVGKMEVVALTFIIIWIGDIV